MTSTVALYIVISLLVMLFARGLHRVSLALTRKRMTRVPYKPQAPLTGRGLLPTRLLCTLPKLGHGHDQDNIQSLAPSLIQFLRESLSRSLVERQSGDGDASELAALTSECNRMADKIFDRIMSEPQYTVSNKELADAGDGLYRALRVVPAETVDGLCDGSVSISSVLTKYKQHIAQNRAVFDIITKHHRSIITEDWNQVTERKEALAKYSSAASTMGTKKWVVESNMWMESFALSYFRHGGARKHYLDKKYNIREAQFPSWDEKKEFVGRFDKDLMMPPGGSSDEQANMQARKIRLLDVGSCYNPIGKSDQAGVFDVTALDLFPADPTVFQCDVLNLAVGPAGSEPVNTTADSQGSVTDQGDNAMTSSSAGKLTQLPAGSFDAVTMSLVLSYLPTPEQRVAMIRKARQLLVSPDASGTSGRPHHTGLLLIAEKPSIFNSKKEHTADSVGKNKAFLLTSWKQAIANEGFELVKYRMMWSDGRCSHLFAFATTDAPVTDRSQEETLRPDAPRMWIKQDFDPLYGQDEADGIVHGTGNGADNGTARDAKISVTQRPVGIVGGGIGGCALALSLQQKKIPYIVFEKDAGFDVRKQGYALTMQQGGPALRALGLGDLLGQHGAVSTNHTSYRWDGTRLGTYGLSKRKPCEGNSTHPAVEPTPAAPQHEESEGKPVKEGLLKSKTRHNVHIPRQKLREIMLQSIHPDNIRWNKKLSTVEMRSGAEISSASVAGVSSAAERHVKLKFEDGTEEEVSALVGADGIYSSVRKALASVGDADQLSARRTDDLKYLGLMVILGIASNPTAEETAAAGAAAFTRTQRQWLDGETRVFSMPYDKDHTMWQLSYPCAEADAIALSTIALHESESSGATKSDILKDEALRRCAGWAPDLVALLSRSERGLVSGHPVYDRDPGALNIIRSLEETIEGEESPVISERVSNWPITLLGDAAHPMSPFKGQGANQAILDALALSRAISSSNLFVPARAKTDGQTGSHRRGIAENLRLYEQDMYAKAAEKVQRSRDAAFYLHNESALAEGNVTRAKAAEDFALSLQSADA